MSRNRPGPTGKIAGVLLSISCEDAEWDRIRRLAGAAGKTISRHLVDAAMEAIALKKAGLEEEAPSPRSGVLVLDAAQQRALLDGVTALAERMPGGRQLAEQAAMVAFLFDAVLLDMARQGRREERDGLLAAHFGGERAAGIAADADRRAAERGLGR